MRATCGGVCGQCAALRQGGERRNRRETGRSVLSVWGFPLSKRVFLLSLPKKQKPRLQAGD